MVVLMSDLGMLPQYWFPKGMGFDYEDSRYTKVVSSFRKRMTIVTGSALPGVDGRPWIADVPVRPARSVR
tara:strand:+ start:803 stop:1012 length:210 start_codon:yes stop_codon:yes gene_type:complete